MQKTTLKQSQKMKQALSAQNIMLFKMIEMDTQEFDDYIKEEMDANPALEAGEMISDKYHTTSISDTNGSILENISTQGYESDVKTSSNYSNYEDDNENFIPVEYKESFISKLLNQLKYRDLTTAEKTIGEFIIGNLDDDGYLRRDLESIVDDLSFRQNIYTDIQTVERIFNVIREFDPPGICATDLRDCLLLQLKRKKGNRIVNLTKEILENDFKEFTKKKSEFLCQKYKISTDELKEVYDYILTLTPNPSETNVNEANISVQIIPDFILTRQNNELLLELNAKNQPNIKVNPYFISMLKNVRNERILSKSDKEKRNFINSKIKAAETFVTLVKERQETMILIMNAIIEYQHEFFMSGDINDMKPCTLKDISKMTGFDISTASRVTSNKFVQTEFGVFSLKYFFGEGIETKSGENISTKVIMEEIRTLINNEDKSNPYTDQEILEILQENGYKIARRTISKYRESLDIPSKFVRKQIL